MTSLEASSGMLSEGRNPKKKMIIKPFKLQPKLPENFEEKTWRNLKEAIVAVQSNQGISFSREELYRSVEDMCTWKMSDRLYTKLKEVCSDHIAAQITSLLNTTPEKEAFLGLVEGVWRKHCAHMMTIRNIFLYLDRTYVIQNPSVKSIWDLGLHLFRSNLSAKPDLQTRITNGLLSLIEQERQGQSVSRTILQELIRMLSALQIYEESFETPFLRQTERFFADDGVVIIENGDVSQFLGHVNRKLTEESERVVHYLEIKTRKPLIAAVEDNLLRPHVKRVLEKGFDALMDINRFDDLKLLYQLFGKINSLEEIKKFLNNYVKKKAMEIVSNKDQDKEMVEKLLEFKGQVDLILERSFQNQVDYLYSVKEAMETSINSRENRPAELIAKFIDSKLRVGSKSGTEEETEVILDRVMVLFKYIEAKDVFEAFYKKDLAKRLLLGRSASFDLEKSMISKMKTECGNSFTNKLEGMFKDIDLSRGIMTQFQQHAASRSALKQVAGRMEVYVQVLTTGFWPAYPPMEVQMPVELAPSRDIFNTFYCSKYQGRRLVWQPSLGQCVLRAHFTSGKKELSVSLFQTLILLCYNNSDQLSFKEISEQTRIEDGELRRTLQSLACGKVRVLQKCPKGRDVEDNDVFVFHHEFTSKLVRLKINSIQMKETVKENEETHERIFRERQYQVDAAIVRIMKARKTLNHPVLMSEIFGQIRFPARAADIKRRIETLIDREYLERDENNPQVYNYLA